MRRLLHTEGDDLSGAVYMPGVERRTPKNSVATKDPVDTKVVTTETIRKTGDLIGFELRDAISGSYTGL
jgi:hypothetical protein